jgi:riboflavin kinase/FMN adenylyltransferase
MLLITNLKDLPAIDAPCGLTIGSFDGVHLGHQTLLKNLRARLPSNGILVVLTFSNHPSHHFSPQSGILLICPPLQKVHYLKEAGADLIILIPFTEAFSQTPFDQFLNSLKQKINIQHLVLGTGATFGKGREGNEAMTKKLGTTLGFKADYLPKFLVNDEPVSSARIRRLIAQGDFEEVASCLGRPYSVMGELTGDSKKQTLHLPGLCLPPDGKYCVEIKHNGPTFQAYASVIQREELIEIHRRNGPLITPKANAEVIFLTN